MYIITKSYNILQETFSFTALLQPDIIYKVKDLVIYMMDLAKAKHDEKNKFVQKRRTKIYPEACRYIQEMGLGTRGSKGRNTYQGISRMGSKIVS